jgi:hypothetical protein
MSLLGRIHSRLLSVKQLLLRKKVSQHR